MNPPRLGVIVVAFNSADVILDCLESLLASTDVQLVIQVVDNASEDDTVDLLRRWASGEQTYAPADDLPFPMQVQMKPIALDGAPLSSGHRVLLTETGVNGGFAYGVNVGLKILSEIDGVERYWILNPDSVVPPGTAHAFATAPAPEEGFALMGGRVLYYDTPDIIQIDGGLLNRKTGVTGNIGLGQAQDVTRAPAPQDMDFITGASMVASRAHYDAAGPMPEDYFLYYEEVDWALRRGTLPLAYCADGIVYHKAGTAIGSPTLGRPASPFSLYFKHRSRLMFMRRWYPRGVVTAIAYSLAKAAQLLLKGYPAEARALLAGTFNRAPPADIRAKLSKAAAAQIFGDGS